MCVPIYVRPNGMIVGSTMCLQSIFNKNIYLRDFFIWRRRRRRRCLGINSFAQMAIINASLRVRASAAYNTTTSDLCAKLRRSLRTIVLQIQTIHVPVPLRAAAEHAKELIA